MSQGRAGSLGGRLSRWLALQSLLGLALVCLAVYAATAMGFQARQAERLQQKQTQVHHLLAEAAAGLDEATLRHKLDDFLVGQQDLRLQLQRADGAAFYGADVPAGWRLARFTAPAGASTLQATLALDTRSDDALLRRIGLTLVAAAWVGAALIATGGHALVRWGLAPVRDLVAQTQRLAAATLHHRLDGSAQPEELGPLITQFNALLLRLERAYEQLEGFNADVAHELCTPLASLITSSELALRQARSNEALREALGANLEDLQRMAGIVQDMLFLSQADRGAQARRTPVPSLAALAQPLADYHEAALAEAGLRLVLQGDASGSFDVALLQRAMSNLVANARRYALPGSEVVLHIASQDGQVKLQVLNRGPAIEARHLPRLFDRFYRADEARPVAARHHGLGLAIVAAIARMHGGAPLVQCSGGTTAIGLRLPPHAGG